MSRLRWCRERRNDKITINLDEIWRNKLVYHIGVVICDHVRSTVVGERWSGQRGEVPSSQKKSYGMFFERFGQKHEYAPRKRNSISIYALRGHRKTLRSKKNKLQRTPTRGMIRKRDETLSTRLRLPYTQHTALSSPPYRNSIESPLICLLKTIVQASLQVKHFAI